MPKFHLHIQQLNFVKKKLKKNVYIKRIFEGFCTFVGTQINLQLSISFDDGDILLN